MLHRKSSACCFILFDTLKVFSAFPCFCQNLICQSHDGCKFILEIHCFSSHKSRPLFHYIMVQRRFWGRFWIMHCFVAAVRIHYVYYFNSHCCQRDYCNYHCWLICFNFTAAVAVADSETLGAARVSFCVFEYEAPVVLHLKKKNIIFLSLCSQSTITHSCALVGQNFGNLMLQVEALKSNIKLGMLLLGLLQTLCSGDFHGLWCVPTVNYMFQDVDRFFCCHCCVDVCVLKMSF